MASFLPPRAEEQVVLSSFGDFLTPPSPACKLKVLFLMLLIPAFLMPASAKSSDSIAWQQELPGTRMPKYLSDRLFSMNLEKVYHFLTSKELSSLTERLCESAHFECDPNVMVPSLEADSGERYLGKLFNKSEIVVGNEITAPDLSSDYPFRAFLPNFLADTLPFGSGKLENMFKILNIPADSRLANYMNLTLYDCEASATKECVKSVEEMVSVVVQRLGRNVQVMRTKWCKEATDKMTIVEMAISGSHRSHSSMVCTEEMFPYLIYNCYEVKHVETIEVTMETDDAKHKVHALMQCYIPSQRLQHYRDFAAVNLMPDDAKEEREMCHWLTEKEIVFVRKTDGEKKDRKRTHFLWRVLLP